MRNIFTFSHTAFMIVMFCLAANSFAQTSIATVIKENGEHIITGNDSVFTDWTEGYLSATTTYPTGNVQAEVLSVTRARVLMLEEVGRVTVVPGITIGMMMKGSPRVAEGMENAVGKCEVIKNKTNTKTSSTTVHFNMYLKNGTFPLLATVVDDYTITAGASSDGNAEGASGGAGGGNKPDNQEKSNEPQADVAGETPDAPIVPAGEQASIDDKQINTLTEKFFKPQLYPDFFNDKKMAVGRFMDEYVIIGPHIPHYYRAGEKLQLKLNDYKGKDMLRSTVHRDGKYRFDISAEVNYVAWRSLSVKAVYFGKYVILFY